MGKGVYKWENYIKMGKTYKV